MALEEEVAQSIFEALLGLVGSSHPALAVPAAVGSTLVDHFFGTRSGEKDFARELRKVSKIVANDILQYADSVSAEFDAGAIRSAVFQFQSALSRANLSLDKLVELEMDPNRLSTYMIEVGHDQFAGGTRRTFYRCLSERFSEDLMLVLPKIPRFNLVILQAIVKLHKDIVAGQRKIIDLLEAAQLDRSQRP